MVALGGHCGWWYCDIDQPQCHKCLSSFSFTIFFCFFIHVWHCSWPMLPMSSEYYPLICEIRKVSYLTLPLACGEWMNKYHFCWSHIKIKSDRGNWVLLLALFVSYMIAFFFIGIYDWILIFISEKL